MSLLRRKRRQNRMELRTIPATREARSSLESDSARGWRNIFGRKFAEQRQRNRPIAVIDMPLDPFGPRYDREVRQAVDFFNTQKIKERVSREFRKPLQTIKLNGQIRVDLPPEHPVCVAREIRREIMFANNKAGRGGQRPRVQNNELKLICKRS